jgi:hypothetical protein
VFANPDFGNSVLSLPGSIDAHGGVPRAIASHKLSDNSALK